jgi:DNA-binding beta-propeller fold protein YncE
LRTSIIGGIVAGAIALGATPAVAADSLYWSAAGGDTSRVGNLDGSGPPSSLFAEPSATTPAGVAIDSATAKIYWADFNSSTIRAANLNGGGSATNLYMASSPIGIEIDPAAGKIYWPSGRTPARSRLGT